MIALGIVFCAFFLGRERCGALEAHQDQDGKRRLDQHSVQRMGLDHVPAPAEGPRGRPLRIVDAIVDGKTAEEDERAPLDHVDDDRRKRRAGDPSIGDVARHYREDDPDKGQLENGKVLSRELVVEVPDQGRHERNHDSWIDPVEQVRRPACAELGHAGHGVRRASLGSGAFEEGLFRKIGCTGKARFRIQLRELRIRDRGEKSEHERDDDACPDVGRSRCATGRRGCRL